MPVTLDLNLRAGEPFLRAAITIGNEASDHRVRAVFPLGVRAERSHADQAFHVTDRGLLAEGGVHEHGLPTYPSRRWVDASDGARGLAIFHRGTPEYELVDDGSALAITLLRCVGWLSRQGMNLRAGPAGPKLEAPGAQLAGTHRFELAVYPHEGDWRGGDVHAIAESFAYPLRAAGVRAQAGPLPREGGALTLEPRCVQLSSLRRQDDATVIRVYNAGDEAVQARLLLGGPLAGARNASRVGILGDVLGDARIDGSSVVVSLRPWEIATVAIS